MTIIPNQNILIVDDVADNLRVLGDLLRDEGYKVRPVPNGKLALQVAEKEKPDLILLDIMMPDLNGFEVCKMLKEHKTLNDVPVIFISALNDTADIVKAFKCGGSDFITKPFMAEEVKARVATHLKIYQQQKELQKLNADKDRFITILAHDLKSPFIGIISFSELLANNIDDYDISKIKSLVSIVHKSSKHFYTLLEDLLNWARVQSGKLTFEPQLTNLNKLCSDVIEVLRLNIDNKSLTVNNYIPIGFEANVDIDMAKTILRNLISNAIKFTPNNGKIAINVEKGDSEITVSVTDTGIGMSTRTLNKLFDVTQIQSSKGTNDETGTGFGLLLCKEFVEKHNGHIWAETEEGNGTTFRFTLSQ